MLAFNIMKKLHTHDDKKLYIFPITVETCEEGGFFASTPTIQGAHAEGETYAEALERLEDVIRIHIELRLKRGENVPFLESQGSMISTIPLPLHISL